MQQRYVNNGLNQPFSVYEMHLGSWMRDPADPARLLNYREIADRLVPYIKELGFTHVEFLPVMEHPYYPSWGYQITGYYAASSRYGSSQDLMYLIEQLHKNGIGVIMDWVPSHYPGIVTDYIVLTEHICMSMRIRVKDSIRTGSLIFLITDEMKYGHF